MTMSNPYEPQALASTMVPQPVSSTPPLVLAPESLSQGLDLGQQAPTLAQPGPVGPVAGVPPPTIADPAAMASVAPPQASMGPPPPPSAMAPNAAMNASGPMPNASTMPPPAVPPPPPDANMTSGKTGAPVAAPPPAPAPPAPEAPPEAPAGAPAEPTTAGAPKPTQQRIQYAGQVDPALSRIQFYNRQIEEAQAARDLTNAGYAERTVGRGKELEDLATNIATTRTVQNAVDSHHAAEMQQIDNTANERATKELANIDAMSKRVGAMKIDPKKAMPKNMGSWIAAAIGAAAGGFVQGFKGGSNPFMDIMNHAIDQQMRADEAEIQNAKGELGTKVSLYGLMRQQAGDVHQAKAAFRKTAWDYAENQINNLKEKSNSVQQKQAYDQMTMGIEGQRLAEKQDYFQRRKGEIVAALTQDKVDRAAAQKLAFDQAAKMYELDTERIKAGREANKGRFEENKEVRDESQTFVPALNGHVATPGITTEITKAVNATDNGLQAIDRLEKLIARGSRLSREDIGRAQQAASILAVSEKDRQGLGQLTGGDWGLLPVTPEDAMQIFNGRQSGKLKELKLFLRAQKANLRRNYIVRDAKGRPVNNATGPAYIPDVEEAD